MKCLSAPLFYTSTYGTILNRYTQSRKSARKNAKNLRQFRFSALFQAFWEKCQTSELVNWHFSEQSGSFPAPFDNYHRLSQATILDYLRQLPQTILGNYPYKRVLENCRENCRNCLRQMILRHFSQISGKTAIEYLSYSVQICTNLRQNSEKCKEKCRNCLRQVTWRHFSQISWKSAKGKYEKCREKCQNCLKIDELAALFPDIWENCH